MYNGKGMPYMLFTLLYNTTVLSSLVLSNYLNIATYSLDSIYLACGFVRWLICSTFKASDKDLIDNDTRLPPLSWRTKLFPAGLDKISTMYFYCRCEALTISAFRTKDYALWI